MNDAALEIEGITKRLGGRVVLDAVTLSHREPSVLVLRGENGSGKSTLLRIAAGLMQQDGGRVRIGGFCLAAERTKALEGLGYLGEAPEMPAELTGKELVSLVASLKRCALPKADLVDRLGVTSFFDARLGTLSLGQHRRVCLLAALTGDPPLVLFDEPTNGLDRDGIAMLVELLKDRSRAGRSSLVASHDAAFVAQAADKVLELDKGRLGAPLVS